MRLRTIATGLTAAVCICLAVWFGLNRKQAHTAAMEEELRFMRAAYVLQHLDANAAAEKVAILPAIKRDDTVNGLLHHTDKVFVLQHLAQELEACTQTVPAASLFAAYARLALGQQEEAARLLNTYVAEAPYNPNHYALLCEALSNAGEYALLYMTCLEWAERAQDCRKDRVLFLWRALMHLERPEEAAELALQGGGCLGSEAQVYAARALVGAGKEAQALALVEGAAKAAPAEREKIFLLWNRLQLSSVF